MTETTSGLDALLDSLLLRAKELAERSHSEVETRLKIPDGGVEREAMIDGMKKGAIASAVLVGLLGTKSGRSLTGSALKLGSLAALGAAAYHGYQSWKNEDGADVIDSKNKEARLNKGSDIDAVHHRDILIIKSLVAAANADGHIDDREVRILRRELIEMHLSDDLADQVELALVSPLSASALSKLINDEQEAAEVYLASRLIIDENSSVQEKGYMADLVTELGISSEFRTHLERQLA